MTKTNAELVADITAGIPDNTAKDVSPADIRARMLDMLAREGQPNGVAALGADGRVGQQLATPALLLTTDVVTPERYGAVGNGSASDHAAFLAMTEEARERGYLHLVCQTDKIYTYAVPDLLCGIPSIIIEGNGAGFRNILGSAAALPYAVHGEGLVFHPCFQANGSALYDGVNRFGDLIDTAVAGADVVTQTSGTVAVTAATRAIIYGFDALGSASFPPNPLHFEYVEIESIDGQDITLKSPLIYNYDSRWSEDTASDSYGKPRIISLDAAEFAEIKSLSIRNLTIKANPGWVHAYGDAERNGRLTLGGYGNAILENVTAEGGCYISQGESILWSGGRIGATLEWDKVLVDGELSGVVLHDVAHGTGTKNIRLKGCTVLGSTNMSPRDSLTVTNCKMAGKGLGSSATLWGVTTGIRRAEFTGNVWNVTETARVHHATTDQKKSAAFTVVSAIKLSLSLADYNTSLFCRVIRERSFLYDTNGLRAFRLDTLPYDVGGTVYFDGISYKAIVNGETLHLSLLDELIVDDEYQGVYGHQIQTGLNSLHAEPLTTRIIDKNRSDAAWTIDDSLIPLLSGTKYFWPGGVINVSKIDAYVSKAYSGAAGGAVSLLIENGVGGTDIVSLDLKTAGRRTIVGAAGTDVVLGADSVTGLPALLQVIQYRSLAAGTYVDASDAARWSVTFHGQRVS